MFLKCWPIRIKVDVKQIYDTLWPKLCVKYHWLITSCSRNRQWNLIILSGANQEYQEIRQAYTTCIYLTLV